MASAGASGIALKAAGDGGESAEPLDGRNGRAVARKRSEDVGKAQRARSGGLPSAEGDIWCWSWERRSEAAADDMRGSTSAWWELSPSPAGRPGGDFNIDLSHLILCGRVVTSEHLLDSVRKCPLVCRNKASARSGDETRRGEEGGEGTR